MELSVSVCNAACLSDGCLICAVADWEGAPVGSAKALAASVVPYGYYHVSVQVVKVLYHHGGASFKDRSADQTRTTHVQYILKAPAPRTSKSSCGLRGRIQRTEGLGSPFLYGEPGDLNAIPVVPDMVPEEDTELGPNRHPR